MLIDSCASGGRRNDIETLRRAVPLLRSDCIFEPIAEQCHTYGISFWMPFNGTGFLTVDTYLIRSQMSPEFTLGVDTRRVTLVLLAAASLVAAVCVSVSGIIGFVGLLVPHSMRLLAGPDNRRLLPVSLLAGAVLLLGADTLIRAVLPAEIPIGVLTALIGGPFFCFVFRRQQSARRIW